ncbi:conserved hypothetical protein [Candidatus Azobacteroides pseudotrichonymphae genomovar. CFP2]|uniref:DUF349 domain-containing protein n=2 Tax=Candidatus Azobacteroides TaxID=511434 RepID=B6YQ42_AZOPC|nr:conserved hypothetical protein [Candidatus Azobacteroides pseudotrichonymphae genomovar. CFP2]
MAICCTCFKLAYILRVLCEVNTLNKDTMDEGNYAISTIKNVGKSIIEIGQENSIEKFSMAISKLNKKEEIVEQLALVIEQPVDNFVRNKVEILKQAFYKLKKIEAEASIKVFMMAGNGTEMAGNGTEEFQKEKDTIEEKLRELLVRFRDKKKRLAVGIKKDKKQDLVDGRNIIEGIKRLIADQDKQRNFREIFDEFKELQYQWKEIARVPQNFTNALWKEYRYFSNQFYDLVKLNDVMRDYDFKKNLELKQELCAAVEHLDREPDVISAFHQMHRFYHKWKEIGPVARECRKDVWECFKRAMSVINQKYQQHFEKLKECEQKKLKEKTVLCEEVENIDYSVLVSFKEWDKQTKCVLEIQNKWKSIGFVRRQHIRQLLDRFNVACDNFFRAKNSFLEGMNATLSANLKKKEALCIEAESLKDSQAWKETTDKLIALQKEWRSVGSVAHKHSKEIWVRFVDACDCFFERKNAYFLSRRKEEVVNLKNKKEIISNIQTIDVSLPIGEVLTLFREHIMHFNNVGFVPFGEKRKIYDKYCEAIDSFFERLKASKSEKELQSYGSDLNTILAVSTGGSTKNKSLGELDQLIRKHSRIKNDIQTYENNIGFVSASSKKGDTLIREIQNKIVNLKSSLTLIEEKIGIIDRRVGS